MTTTRHSVFCAKCLAEMQPAKNEVKVVTHYGQDQRPYEIWSADLLICSGNCGAAVVARFGAAPLSREDEPGFKKLYDRTIKDPSETIVRIYERKP